MLLKEIYRIYHIIWGKENTGWLPKVEAQCPQPVYGGSGERQDSSWEKQNLGLAWETQ